MHKHITFHLTRISYLSLPSFLFLVHSILVSSRRVESLISLLYVCAPQ